MINVHIDVKNKEQAQLIDWGQQPPSPLCVINKNEAIELAMELLKFSGLQPMETAPRDGSPFLTKTINDCWTITWWVSAREKIWSNNWSNGDTCYDDYHFRGWLPLPKDVK